MGSTPLRQAHLAPDDWRDALIEQGGKEAVVGWWTSERCRRPDCGPLLPGMGRLSHVLWPRSVGQREVAT
jgi:hypothetical protein